MYMRRIRIAGTKATVLSGSGDGLALMIDTKWILEHDAQQTDAVLTDFVGMEDDLSCVLRVLEYGKRADSREWNEDYLRVADLAHDGCGEVQRLAQEALSYTLLLEERRAVGEGHKRKAIHGFVYVMRCGPHYKIGASKNPGLRLTQLQTQPPFDIEGVMGFETDDMLGLERLIHEYFADKRVNGEWFLLDDDDIVLLPAVADECREKMAT